MRSLKNFKLSNGATIQFQFKISLLKNGYEENNPPMRCSIKMWIKNLKKSHLSEIVLKVKVQYLNTSHIKEDYQLFNLGRYFKHVLSTTTICSILKWSEVDTESPLKMYVSYRCGNGMKDFNENPYGIPNSVGL